MVTLTRMFMPKIFIYFFIKVFSVVAQLSATIVNLIKNCFSTFSPATKASISSGAGGLDGK